MQRTNQKTAKDSAPKRIPKNAEKPKTIKPKKAAENKEKVPRKKELSTPVSNPVRGYTIDFHTSGTVSKETQARGRTLAIPEEENDPSWDYDYRTFDDDELKAYLNEYSKAMPLHLIGGGGAPRSLLDQAWNSFVQGDYNPLTKYLAYSSKEDLDYVLKHLNQYNPTSANSVDEIKDQLKFRAPVAEGCQIIGGKQMTIKSYTDRELGPAINLRTQIPIGTLRNNLGTLQVAALGTANWVNNSIRLGPDDLGGRSAALAALYSRWRAHHYMISYIPGCPSTTTGMLAMGISTDPDFDEATAGSMGTILQLQPSRMGNIWTPCEIKLDEHQDGAALYTDGNAVAGAVNDERLTNAGKLMVIATGLDPSLSGEFLGTLVCCVDFSLYSPNPSNGVTIAAILRRDMGHANFEKFMSTLIKPGNLEVATHALGLYDPDKVKMIQASLTLTKQVLNKRRKSIDFKTK